MNPMTQGTKQIAYSNSLLRLIIMGRWENSSKINKRGGSNKACSWENFLKKNKKNSMLIRDFRVTDL